MAIRLAVIGLDLIQLDWLRALQSLAEKGTIEFVAAGHRSAALTKDLADALAVPGFDDLRQLFLKTAPQVILLDRPDNFTLDHLKTCWQQGIGILSLGPPVWNLAEARAAAELLEPRTALLYVWPRFASTAVFRHGAQADEFVRPVRFAAAEFHAPGHALAKSRDDSTDAVRSLSVLAWEALALLIELAGLPESIYASFRGTGGGPDHFADLSGAAALTLRFPDQVVASLTLSDRLAPARRQLLLLGQNGTLQIDRRHYEFTDAAGQLIDSGEVPPEPAAQRAATVLTEFLEQFTAPPSPHRGWEHRLELISAALEAMLVSHRTGQPELPERFLSLRR